MRWSVDVSYVFVALSAAVAVFGLVNATAVAGGAWFGPISWRRLVGAPDLSGAMPQTSRASSPPRVSRMS
jgi:hypothetical protein